MQLAQFTKFGVNIKNFSEHPRHFTKIINFLKELDTEEISLISSCIVNFSKLRCSKRIALWNSIRIFLED